MKLLRSYYNLLEAGSAQSLLESSGTSAVLEHEHLLSGLLVRDVWSNLLGANRLWKTEAKAFQLSILRQTGLYCQTY